MTVPKILIDNAYVPDIPEGLEYKSYSLNPDGETYTVILSDEYYEKERQSIRSASQFIIAKELLSDAIPDDEIEKFKPIFDNPVSGETYKLDWVLKDPVTGELFRIVQPQVTWEAHWKIAEIPSIVTPFRKKNEITPWKQPAGAHDAYQIGDKVSYNGVNWESKINANTTVPDGDVPFNRYWNPL